MKHTKTLFTTLLVASLFLSGTSRAQNSEIHQ